ncbi:MAG TPA: LLM class flavin-dependent oxidoreductase [Ktedonobacterales bacterium]|nr:LLM class flavin-dependent oxidoreductase [Ktedonobacterales bacterium]
MRFGVTLPNVGLEIDELIDLAVEAESAGWDGVFAWDALYVHEGEMATLDPWIALSAVAMRTQRVRLGTMITPLSRRRPWKVARETASLDRLSQGRFILPVGLGAIDDGGYSKVGEELDRKRRAEMLDESLDILAGLWSGKPFSYEGKHYHVQEMTFLPTPAQFPQSPHVPVWVVGAWPRMKSLRRAFRWDGIIPAKMNADGSSADMTPDDLRELRALAERERPADAAPLDIIYEDETPGDDPARAQAIIQPLAEAGVTWWLESVWKTPETQGGVAGMRERVRQGPPKIE